MWEAFPSWSLSGRSWRGSLLAEARFGGFELVQRVPAEQVGRRGLRERVVARDLEVGVTAPSEPLDALEERTHRLHRQARAAGSLVAVHSAGRVVE